jgi:hypothetical protein
MQLLSEIYLPYSHIIQKVIQGAQMLLCAKN